jgi:hypothetical protein
MREWGKFLDTFSRYTERGNPMKSRGSLNLTPPPPQERMYRTRLSFCTIAGSLHSLLIDKIRDIDI